MYRKIVLFISILLLLSLSSCVSSTSQIKRGANNEWILVKNKLKFNDIPAWETIKEKFSVFTFNKRGQGTIRISVWNDNSSLSLNELRDAANKSLNSLKSGWKDVNIQKESESIIGGRKAYFMKYEYKHMDRPHIGAFYLTFYEGQAYQFRASVIDKFPECMQDYDNWIKTIEFLSDIE